MSAVEAPRRRSALHRLTVAAVERLTDDAVAITFEVPDELRETFAFAAGQHVALALPGAVDGVRRSYSICTPAGCGVLRVGVKRLPGGAFSEHAFTHLTPGDELDVLPPSGRFTLDLDPLHARHYAAVAAGSGITPVLSLAATALAVEPRSELTLLYGNRTTASIMFLEELQDLKNRYPDRFVLANVLSREPQEAELLSGRIDGPKLRAFLATLLPAETVDEWFLCGPIVMVEELRGTLLEAGVPAARIHRELFHTGPPAPRSAPERVADEDELASVTISLDGRTSAFRLARHGESILDAALRVRSDAPYACKGGVCGTCRARLVEGEVEMDQCYALEPDEVESGVVLACQSHPRSHRVVLDFDV